MTQMRIVILWASIKDGTAISTRQLVKRRRAILCRGSGLEMDDGEERKGNNFEKLK